jgi:hypothetical protein
MYLIVDSLPVFLTYTAKFVEKPDAYFSPCHPALCDVLRFGFSVVSLMEEKIAFHRKIQEKFPTLKDIFR